MLVNVTHLAVRHAIVCWDALGLAVTVHAVSHFRQGQVGKACTLRNSIVAGDTVEMICLAFLEMLRVGKLYVFVLP